MTPETLEGLVPLPTLCHLVHRFVWAALHETNRTTLTLLEQAVPEHLPFFLLSLRRLKDSESLDYPLPETSSAPGAWAEALRAAESLLSREGRIKLATCLVRGLQEELQRA